MVNTAAAADETQANASGLCHRTFNVLLATDTPHHPASAAAAAAAGGDGVDSQKTAGCRTLPLRTQRSAMLATDTPQPSETATAAAAAAVRMARQLQSALR